MHTIGQLTCPVNIFNEKINNYEYFEINFKVLDIKYDMIIGRHTIKKYDLTQVCRSQFTVSHTDYVLPADGNPFAKAHKSELRAGTRSVSNRHSKRYIRKYLNKNIVLKRIILNNNDAPILNNNNTRVRRHRNNRSREQ
jgi:hypothetical protein